MALIELSGVSKSFAPVSRSDSAVDALQNVSLSVEAGAIFGIIGYSGAGKSTLVRVINALESVNTGTVTIDGQHLESLNERDIRRVRSQIGMVFQQFNLFNSKTVYKNVAYPLHLAGWENTAIAARVTELLEFVGLSDKARAYPEQLSGGQKQRVGIARALATRPSILLADEATSALDPQTTREVLELLKRANANYGVTIVVITHEMEVVKQLATHVAVMDSGQIVEVGTVVEVLANPTSDVTKSFVASVIQGQPTQAEFAALSAAHPGRIVTISARNQPAAHTELIAKLVSAGITVDLVRGGITDIQGESVGHLTLAMQGDDATIDALLADAASTLTVREGAA